MHLRGAFTVLDNAKMPPPIMTCANVVTIARYHELGSWKKTDSQKHSNVPRGTSPLNPSEVYNIKLWSLAALALRLLLANHIIWGNLGVPDLMDRMTPITGHWINGSWAYLHNISVVLGNVTMP